MLMKTFPLLAMLSGNLTALKELGFANLEFSAWFGVVAPAKTPEDILNKLNAEVVKAVTGADARTKLQDMGFKVTGTTRAEFAAVIKSDTARWGKAVAATGFKAD